MNVQRCKLMVLLLALCFGAVALFASKSSASSETRGQKDIEEGSLDTQLQAVLNQHGFTGKVGKSVERRLGRRVNGQLAEIGRLAFHDSFLGLNNDNSCAGCHAASTGFGDTQSIAIGIESNNVVGPDRAGPRNQRRTPMILNNVFYRRLMWNSRFESLSGDPFNNGMGFLFPQPEGMTLSHLPHLLTAQAFIPPTEKPEMAGFGPGVPNTNDGIRAAVIERLNTNTNYRQLFGTVFPEVNSGANVTYEMLARAIAEFEFTLVFADAPIDRFARGQMNAMTDDQKRGALLFFGQANCVQCHAVSGQSNEMFSDFQQHVIGIPQIAPSVGNVTFDGPGMNEDFGLEQVTGNSADRYAFRTSPLRNVVLQPTFFHNGAFTSLEAAVRHHLNVMQSANSYNPVAAGVDADLQGPMGPLSPVLTRVDPLLTNPINLTEEQIQWLLAFVRDGLHDQRATPENLRQLIPRRTPSRRPMHIFQ